jgi:hypothetical protein
MGLQVIGLDLGQRRDPSALSVLDVGEPPPIQLVNTWTGRITYEPSKTPPALHIRHLERFALGTRYTTIVTIVRQRVQALTSVHGRPVLVIDKTGCGSSVCDMFFEAGLAPVPVTITAGHNVTQDSGGFNVPKRELVSVLQATLQTERLKFAESLPDTPTLTQELLNFTARITLTGHDTYGAAEDWRVGNHDDLVLSVSLAVFYAEKLYIPPWTAEDLAALSQQINRRV